MSRMSSGTIDSERMNRLDEALEKSIWCWPTPCRGGHPGQASVLDLRGLLDDEEHISPARVQWLRAALLPKIAEAGASHFGTRSAPAGG